MFVLVRLRWDQFSPQSRSAANTNIHVGRLTSHRPMASLSSYRDLGCVGVVREERGLKLISLIPHILNMRDSGPAGDKKENMLRQKLKKEAMLTRSLVIYPAEAIECKV